jgi:hypothetical protein
MGLIARNVFQMQLVLSTDLRSKLASEALQEIRINTASYRSGK